MPVEEVKRRDNVVWILGAGFSRPLGAPLLPDLLSTSSVHKVASVYPNCFPYEGSIWRLVPAIYEAGASRHPACFQAQWEHAEEFLERLDLAGEKDSHEATNLNAFLNRLFTHWTRLGNLDMEVRGNANVQPLFAQDFLDVETITSRAALRVGFT